MKIPDTQFSLPDANSIIDRAAQLGIPLAQWKIGSRYLMSAKNSADIEQAKRFFQKAATGGVGLGWDSLAALNESSEFGRRNVTKAREAWRHAADCLACPESQYRYAQSLLKAKLPTPRLRHIKQYLQLASWNHHGPAKVLLATIEAFDGLPLHHLPELDASLHRRFHSGDRHAGYTRALWRLYGFRQMGQNIDTALQMLRAVADDGYPPAMIALGMTLCNMSNTEQQKQGIQWLIEAQNGPDSSALIELGKVYQQGPGTPHNLDVAQNYYERASAAGHPEADGRIADVIFERGPQDQKQAEYAMSLFEKSAHAGARIGHERQGLAVLCYPQFFPHEDTTNRQRLENHAMIPDNYAMVALGDLHKDATASCNHEDENFIQAYFWYHMASEQCSPEGMMRMAELLNGQDDINSKTRLVGYLQCAASLGNTMAHALLGQHYLYSRKILTNPLLAARFSEFAAKNDSYDAAINCMTQLDLGWGVEPDENMAETYYRQAVRIRRDAIHSLDGSVFNASGLTLNRDGKIIPFKTNANARKAP